MSDFEKIQRSGTGARARQALQFQQKSRGTVQVIDKRNSLAGKTLQREEDARFNARKPLQKKANNTGLPDNLKTGMENLSGYSLDHVKVHYNSSKPAAVQAHAYAQGSNIHLGSGQETHLPHELGHVVQQMQGRVKPTTTVGGVSVNDNAGLENEATQMGEKALQRVEIKNISSVFKKNNESAGVIQGWFNSIDNVPDNLKPTSDLFRDGEMLAIANWIQNKNGGSTTKRGRMAPFVITPANHVGRPYSWSVAYHTDFTNHSHGGVDTPHTHISTYVNNVGNTVYTIPSDGGAVNVNGPNLGPVFTPWNEANSAMDVGMHSDTIIKLRRLLQTWTETNAGNRYDLVVDNEDEDNDFNFDMFAMGDDSSSDGSELSSGGDSEL